MFPFLFSVFEVNASIWVGFQSSDAVLWWLQPSLCMLVDRISQTKHYIHVVLFCRVCCVVVCWLACFPENERWIFVTNVVVVWIFVTVFGFRDPQDGDTRTHRGHWKNCENRVGAWQCTCLFFRSTLHPPIEKGKFQRGSIKLWQTQSLW